MKTIHAALILVLVSAGMASARSIPVQSGEHDTFTRLVLDFPSKVKFSARQEQNNYTITFKQEDFEFDTSRVFERLNSDRIVSFPNDENAKTFIVQLGCNCNVRYYWYLEKYLVLDISDRKKNNDYQDGSTAIIDFGTSLSFGEAIVPEGQKVDTSFDEVLEGNFELPSRALDAKRTGASSLLSNLDEELVKQREISQIEKRLLEEIGKAASEGLLSPTLNQLGSPPKKELKNEIDKKKSIGPQNNQSEAPLQLRSSSSTNPMLMSVEAASSVEDHDLKCLPEEKLDIKSWAQPDEFAKQLGAGRALVTSETGLVNEIRALDLARTYIYWGFGAEASKLMKAVGPNGPLSSEFEIILDIADVIEYGEVDNPNIFGNIAFCGGAQSMWSLLAMQEENPFERVSREPVIRAFASLPPQIKNIVAAPLSGSLRDLGEVEMANTIMRLLVNEQEHDGALTNLAQVEATVDYSVENDRIDALAALASSSLPTSYQAMIEYVDASMGAGLPLDDETIQLLEVMIIEGRRGKNFEQLAKSLAAALSYVGRHGEAIDFLNKSRKSRPEIGFEIDVDQAYFQLAVNGPSDDFLEIVFPLIQEQSHELSSDTWLEISRRLIEEGFYEEAIGLLSNSQNNTNDPRVDLFHAEALIGAKGYREAISVLSNKNSDRALELRARALEFLESYEHALPLYRTINDQNSVQRVSRKMEDGLNFVAGDESRVSTMSDIVTSESNSVVDSEMSPLLLGRSLVESSSEKRKAVNRLLGGLSANAAGNE